jgi:hypothetical protein
VNCLIRNCHRRARLVPLPLVARSVWVCDVHRGARFIAVMRELVAHG